MPCCDDGEELPRVPPCLAGRAPQIPGTDLPHGAGLLGGGCGPLPGLVKATEALHARSHASGQQMAGNWRMPSTQNRQGSATATDAGFAMSPHRRATAVKTEQTRHRDACTEALHPCQWACNARTQRANQQLFQSHLLREKWVELRRLRLSSVKKRCLFAVPRQGKCWH